MINIMGYSEQQIQQLIIKDIDGRHEMKTVDFTRAEAIKNKCHGIAYPEAFIQTLEALGLIEFKPEPKPETHTPHSVLTKSLERQGSTANANLLIGALQAKGYEIKKIYNTHKSEANGSKVMKLYEHISIDGGTIKLETWPEGLVLWVNGKIKYKYWEDTDK